jgi:hypothetical protein
MALIAAGIAFGLKTSREKDVVVAAQLAAAGR